MVKNEALEKLLNYVTNDYNKNNNFNLQEPYNVERGYDSQSGFKIIYDNKITDFYALDIDTENKDSKQIINVSWIDRLKYKHSGYFNKQKLIKKFNIKYIKPKEHELENLVHGKMISKIENQSNEINFKLNSLTDKIDNISKINLEIHKGVYNNQNNPENNLQINQNKNKKYKIQNNNLSYRKDVINDYIKQNPNKRLIISLKEISTSDIKSYTSELAYKINQFFPDTNSYFLNSAPFMALKGDPKDIKKIAKTLCNKKIKLNNLNSLNSDFVKYVELEDFYFLPEIGNQFEKTKFKKKGLLWNLKNIGVDIAHEYAKGEGIKVGIIDTGVDYDHEEICERFDFNDLGFNFINNSKDPMDDNGHGTHVAGTVAGENVGVAPLCQLYALKVLNSSGFGSSYDIMQAVDWAIQKNLDIINLSLGSDTYLKAEQELYNYAFKSGLLIVASAGNSYDHSHHYPASYKNVLSVAAVDRNNDHAEFSTRNNMVDISAPGVEIVSSIPDDEYAKYNGTSMASPHITGSSALIKSFEYLDPKEIENLLFNSSLSLGDSEYFGHGLVQVGLALDLLNLFKNKKGGVKNE